MLSFLNTPNKCRKEIESIEKEIKWMEESGNPGFASVLTSKRQSLAFWQEELVASEDYISPEATAKRNESFSKTADDVEAFLKKNPNLSAHIRKSMRMAAKSLR